MDLPDELLVYLYSFMLDETVLTAALVCKTWKDIALDDQLWRIRASFTSSNAARLSTSQLDTEPNKWVKLYKELSDVFVPTRMLNLLQEGIEASSTDNQQELSNTLSKDELFWSSTGSANPDSNEHIVYKLVQPLCIVKCIDIYAYKALYQSGMPIYAPQYIRVSVGFSPNRDNMHYTSEPFPIQNIDALQQLTLPEPQLGGFVRLDLLGRYKTQPGDDLYYTVLRHVRVGGVPSGALMDKIYLTNALLRCAFDNEFFCKNFDIENNGEMASRDVFEITKNKLQHGISASLQIERRKLDEKARIAQLIEEEKYPAAAKLAVFSASELDLRNEEVLALFKKSGGLRSYFSVLLISRAALNASESLALAELSTQQADFNLFDSFLRSEKIQSSEELGDYFVQHNKLNLAVYVYIRAHIPDKVNDTLLLLGQYAKIINYATITMRRLDFASMLEKFSQMHPLPLTYEFALALAVPHNNTNAFLSHSTIREILNITAPDLIKYLTNKLAGFSQQPTGPLVLNPNTPDLDTDEEDGEDGEGEDFVVTFNTNPTNMEVDADAANNNHTANNNNNNNNDNDNNNNNITNNNNNIN